MNPYKSKETPPVTQVGMVWVRPMIGEKKPKQMEKTQANMMTLTDAILVTPMTATFSPYVVLAAPQQIPETAVAIPSPIRVLVRPGSVRRSLWRIPDIFLWSPICSQMVTKETGMKSKAIVPIWDALKVFVKVRIFPALS